MAVSYTHLKVGNEDGKTLEELHDKIKEDLTKALYSANYSLERYYFEERAKHKDVYKRQDTNFSNKSFRSSFSAFLITNIEFS